MPVRAYISEFEILTVGSRAFDTKLCQDYLGSSPNARIYDFSPVAFRTSSFVKLLICYICHLFFFILTYGTTSLTH